MKTMTIRKQGSPKSLFFLPDEEGEEPRSESFGPDDNQILQKTKRTRTGQTARWVRELDNNRLRM